MKLALIPPLAHINSIRHTNYQLMLPHLTWSEKYDKAYKASRKRGDYIILDNGAAEGTLWECDALHDIAHEYMVHEIVAPDVLGNMKETRELVEEFAHNVDPLRFNYMGVIQGKNIDECRDIMTWYMNDHPWITCLGVPRHLFTTMGGDFARMAVVDSIRRRNEEIDIHLLGTNPLYIKELEGYGRAYNALNVRGVDTSAPFNYTAEGALLIDGECVKRGEDYFNTKLPQNSTNSWLNITTIKQWVRGRDCD